LDFGLRDFFGEHTPLRSETENSRFQLLTSVFPFRYAG
jgi:hypothetical protein